MTLSLSQYRSAHHIGLWNPSHAIEGWREGAAAYGRPEDAAIFAAALDFQRRWSQRILRNFERRGPAVFWDRFSEEAKAALAGPQV